MGLLMEVSGSNGQHFTAIKEKNSVFFLGLRHDASPTLPASSSCLGCPSSHSCPTSPLAHRSFRATSG